MHHLLRNGLSAPQSRALHVQVVDARGRAIPGAEVRLHRAGMRGGVLGTRLVDTGSGYNSQSVLPLHFAQQDSTPFDVEVIVPARGERRVTRVPAAEVARAGALLVVRVR
jgi:hypothetical protein